MKDITKALANSITSIVLIFFLASCQDNDTSYGQVQFEMIIKKLPKVSSKKYPLNSNKNEMNQDNKKVVEDAQDKNITSVTVSIASKNDDDSCGEEIYKSQSLTYDMVKGISEPLSLKPGNYCLTEFSAQNQSKQTIYLSPLKNSEFANHVKVPLPIEIKIHDKTVTKVKLEVIECNESTPLENFGYEQDLFTIVKMTTFDMVVFDEKTQFTSFDLKVSSNEKGVKKVFIDKHLPAGTYGVRVPDTYSEFDIEVSKNGYQTQTFHKTLAELKETSYLKPKGILKVYLKPNTT